MIITQEQIGLLKKATLDYGGHHSPEQGMCAMEMVSYIAGERFSSRPECACPVITAFMISFNDTLPDNATRDRWIKPLILAIAGSRVLQADGTKDKDVFMRRSLIAGDAALRYFIPFTLDIASKSFASKSFAGYDSETWAKDGAEFFTKRAAALRALPEHTSFEELALTARTAHIDLTNRADFASTIVSAAHTDFAALAVCADTNFPTDRADICTDLADLAAFAARAYLDVSVSDQINKARVATVLKMLAVQSKVAASATLLAV